jgi:phage FluMu protein Com
MRQIDVSLHDSVTNVISVEKIGPIAYIMKKNINCKDINNLNVERRTTTSLE